MAGAAPSVAVWGLDPAAGRDGCGCSGCAACRSHGANKIFASAAAADASRAHPRCRCVVTQIDSVDSGVYEALFVDDGSRSSVDRRWQWVQAALTLAAPVAPPPVVVAPALADPAPAPPIDLTQPLDVFPAPAPAVGPTLRSAWVRREPQGRRVLYVQLVSDLPVSATVGLPDDQPRVRRHLSSVSGRQTVAISLPARVAHGPARLRVRFREANGRAHHVTRLVSIPARKPHSR